MGLQSSPEWNAEVTVVVFAGIIYMAKFLVTLGEIPYKKSVAWIFGLT